MPGVAEPCSQMVVCVCVGEGCVSMYSVYCVVMYMLQSK